MSGWRRHELDERCVEREVRMFEEMGTKTTTNPRLVRGARFDLISWLNSLHRVEEAESFYSGDFYY